MRDVETRQRNIVFPDTVQNEGRFWRGILRGEKRLTLFQKIATAVVVLLVVATWTLVLLRMGNGERGGSPIWAKVLNVAAPLGIGVGVILSFLALIAWQLRREKSRSSEE